MTTIREEDFIQSVADAFQYISYYHPADYIAHLARAYAIEQGPAAKDAIAQILTNSKMCAEGHRPICQDTGIVNVFLKIGMDVRFEGFAGSVEDAVNDGVRKGYLDADNPLRASIVGDPHFERKNTRDNTPAVVQMTLVPGATVDVIVAAKGGGSENKAKFVMMNPSDSLVDWVLKTVPTMGAGWCPPGILGIGIGGTAEKAMLMAKQSLMEDIDMHELRRRGPANKTEALRIELHDKVNALGIGAQGLGGLTTVLDVKIAMAPSSLPVATRPASAESATLRAPPCVSMKRSGSRQSSTSGAAPERVKAYAVWSTTIAGVPCFCRSLAFASAEPRSGKVMRTMNGLWVVATPAAPNSVAMAAASAAPAYGPIVTRARLPGVAVAFIDTPRSAVLSSVPSSLSRLSMSRKSAHPVSTSLMIRASASGWPASAYASASVRRTPRASASVTRRSLIGPLESTATAMILVELSAMTEACALATAA